MNRTNRMVIRTLTAVFDGECLRLDGPHDLALLADRRYLIAVQADPLPAGEGVAWDTPDATATPPRRAARLEQCPQPSPLWSHCRVTQCPHWDGCNRAPRYNRCADVRRGGCIVYCSL